MKKLKVVNVQRGRLLTDQLILIKFSAIPTASAWRDIDKSGDVEFERFMVKEDTVEGGEADAYEFVGMKEP